MARGTPSNRATLTQQLDYPFVAGRWKRIIARTG